MCTTPLYCTTSALYTFSYTGSTNQSSGYTSTHSVIQCRPIGATGCGALLPGAPQIEQSLAHDYPWGEVLRDDPEAWRESLRRHDATVKVNIAPALHGRRWRGRAIAMLQGAVIGFGVGKLL